MFAVVSVAIGSGLLLAGRKLFWLFLGGIGFLVGLEVATRITFRSDLVLILSALALGVVFALMAVFLESVAIGMAGFFGGGIVLARLFDLLGLDAPVMRTVLFWIGAIVGVILAVRLLNWALVSISALAGASMIVGGLFLRGFQRPLLFLALLALGIAFQVFQMHREGAVLKPRQAPPK